MQMPCIEFYVCVTVHSNKFLYNKTNQKHQFQKFISAWNSVCFWQFLCPSSVVHSLYTRQWYMSHRFEDSFRAGPGWSVYSEWTPDDGQRNFPKYVQFHDKINLWNWCFFLVLLQRKSCIELTNNNNNNNNNNNKQNSNGRHACPGIYSLNIFR